jgi:hypothetical protein
MANEWRSGNLRSSTTDHISFVINTFATMQVTRLPTAVTGPRLLASRLETLNVGALTASMVFTGMCWAFPLKITSFSSRISDLDGACCWSLRNDDNKASVCTLSSCLHIYSYDKRQITLEKYTQNDRQHWKILGDLGPQTLGMLESSVFIPNNI